MKDNSLDGHRGKVALSDSASLARSEQLKSPDAPTNFDDDYHEWELGIGDLIIDLDADIEKSAEPMSFEHHATVDKGLKMKIKRKTIGCRHSEPRLEIVPADGEARPKHSSSKGRASGHKRDKARRAEVNGSPLKVVSSPPALCSNSSPLPAATPASSPGMPARGPSAAGSPAEASQQSPPMPNLTLKLEGTPAVVIKAEERPDSPPQKKIKLESPDSNEEDECSGSPSSPEMKDNSTCTSVGTVVEPDCLGPCEPGTSVMLEGIVWQETEGGVLVVNVTWRGKTYVGTLLDCTKHDWAPPRFCESPTSDVDSKTNKGRGKRGGRNNNNNTSEANTFTDTRNCVQSKLRNGKGRRITINSNAANSGFTVPNSPAKGDNGLANNKRKSRPDSEPNQSTPQCDNSKSSKRNRTQNRATPTSTAAELSQPSSPQLIECPEPNCNKRYKHINGLKYHQTHAHSAEGGKIEDPATEDSKDVTNSSDNEESLQESASVSTSPAPTFANSVPSSGKIALSGENPSSSPSGSGLPETDPFSLTTDLSTLASVAISDSVPQEAPCDGAVSALPIPISSSTSNSASPSPALSTSSEGLCSSASVSAVTTSVIQSSNSLDSISIPQAISGNIPHVIFSQGLLGTNNATTCTYTSPVSNSSSLSPSRSGLSSSVTVTFATMSSISSTTVSSPSSLPLIDKSKIKQEKPDRYKPKSPLPSPSIRPIVPAPAPQLLPLASSVAGSHPSINIPGHSVSQSLKPIQPKPTILGEPTTINPALESLKKDKMKHKKKSKDKDRERDKKVPSLPLTPTKLGANPNDECEALELTSYPSLDMITAPLPRTALSPLLPQAKPPESSLEMSLPDDTINENIQSPAYSDISDANDTAPVLESEVPSGKEKEDKIGKTTPDASQSPVANISAYGMYPYYSQPPYLLPSVSPQSAAAGSQGPNVLDKPEISKKNDQDRIKENRPWSNSSSERDRQHLEHESSKKQSREENPPSSSAVSSSPAATGVPVQEYPMPQHYPYPYGYVQGYPYPVDSSAYHMHMIESDPHYKQQYKQYIDEQHRIYKEQQHHHQQIQHQQPPHHSQQQHQHQSSHHPSKSHHSSIKEERDRSRESKDREKMPGSGIIMEHASKIQHASLVPSKEADGDARPPSLPAQASTPSSAALKEKQNENHQILKENIELKSQMDDSKNKINQYEMAMIYERHREDMRRYYMMQDRVIEQQQQKMEPGVHHHTHHHHQVVPPPHHPPKGHKDEHHPKPNHYGDRSSVVSPAKSDHAKAINSSPKARDPSKEYKKDVGKEREDKKADKPKSEIKQEPEGQKPTMETTGPPPPPTNSYAYLHPSYLQPPPPHFPHMPFEPAMYRGGMNPMIVSAPHYGNSPYVHPQIRYVAPEMPPQAPSGPPKALDLLHQVSQHYTSSHKIHELQDHALMSPTPTSAPSAVAPKAEPSASAPKGDGPRDAARSPPTQRHLHTHHHTHVGVGYPIYDPYGVAAQKTFT